MTGAYRHCATPMGAAMVLMFVWIAGAEVASAADATGTKSLADYLLTKSVDPSGVVTLPRCGDGQLAVALATRADAPIVYAADSRIEQYTAARNAAAQAGLLGRTVYVQQAEAAKLPLAACYADLVVLTDLADGDLQPPLLAEIQRILVPLNGRAVVGRTKSAAAAGKLSAAALEAWAKAGGVATDVKIVDDAQGLWAVFGRPALAGAEDWTHWFHGPDNNPLSADTAFTGLPQIGWLAKPYHLPFSMGGRVAAHGRIYLATGPGAYEGSWQNSLKWKLFAYNAFNGRLLWTQPWPENQRTQASVIIANDDILLAAAGAEVKRIDGATGKELGKYAPAGADAGQIKWMGLIDGILAVLIGPAEMPDANLKPAREFHPSRAGYGSILVACDPATGKQIWRHDLPKPLDCQQIAETPGHLYHSAMDVGVVCLNIKDGTQIWANATPEVTDMLDKGKVPPIRDGEAACRPCLVVTPDVVIAGLVQSRALLALSVKDGKLLWSKPYVSHGYIRNLVRGNELFAPALTDEKGACYNLLTGAPSTDAKPPVIGMGCGTFTGSTKYLVGQIGGPLFDFDTHKTLRAVNLKALCGMGEFISQGQLFSPPTACFCGFARGFASLVPAGDLDYKHAPNITEQLVTGVGDIQQVAALASDERDWTAHRGNATHTGCVAVDAPATAPKALWTYTPPMPFAIPTQIPFSEETEHKLTEAVTAGGLVFFGSSDGRVQCLSAADGTPKWTYWTEGGIFAAPTIAQGRLYVGSADGRVYALEAVTGRLLWRFRPGPSDRRILVYGYLQSPWPVNSGVLVADGVAYAAAGMTLQPGSYVVALDAVTGTPRWQHTDPGAANDVGDKAPRGLMPTGYMTLAAGRLWVRSFLGNSGGFAFDPATGNPLPPVISTGGLTGREIGVLRDRYLVYGGGEIYNDQTYREPDGGGTVVLELAADGTPQLPDMCFVKPSKLAQAWNHDNIVTFTSGPGQLQCWDVSRTIAWSCDPAKRIDLAKAPEWRRDQFPLRGGLDEKGNKDAKSVHVWGPVLLQANGLVMTSKAVIVANSVKAAKAANKSLEWQLSAVSLADGTPLWQTPLPSEPVTNTISMDRQGRILLALRDGSVVCYGEK